MESDVLLVETVKIGLETWLTDIFKSLELSRKKEAMLLPSYTNRPHGSSLHNETSILVKKDETINIRS
jgi:hypothetical protein